MLVVCLAAAFTTLLDQSSLNTAIPALRDSLGAGPGTIQWIIAGYSLTFGLALIPSGRLGDAYGRKWLFIGGVALFAAAGVVAGTATEPWAVAVARLVQGLGAGTVNPQVLGIIQDRFAGRERTRALGAYATVGGIAGVIGPVAGGSAIGVFGPEHGWRYVLLLSLPLGLLTIPLALKWLPGDKPARARRLNLDLPGLALLASATLCLLLPFVLPDGQGPPRFLWPLAATALTGLFIAWERRYARRGRTPVLMPVLVRSRGYRLGTLIATFHFGSNLSASLALTLFLQAGLGWTPLHAALTVLPSALGFAVASALSWRLVSRYGRASVVWALVASVLAMAGTLAVVLWVPEGRLGIGLTLTQLAMGVTSGLIISPNRALTLAHAPAGSAGVAGGFLQLAQRISATVVMAAVGGMVLSVAPGSPRLPVTQGLAICAAMLTVAAILAAVDLRPTARISARSARPPG